MKHWVVAKDGMVGQDLLSYLGKKGEEVIGSSKAEADVTSYEALKAFYEKHSPKYIYNCSANVNVDKMESEEKEVGYRVNRDGPAHLAKLAKEKGAKLIHICTDYVFDGQKVTDYEETDETSAVCEYGASKLAGEEEMLSMYPESVSVRTASLYGLGADGLIAGIVKALSTKEQCQHISDQVSTPTYTKDLVMALYDLRDQSGIFHYVNEGYCSRYDLMVFVRQVMDEMGMPIMCEKVLPIHQSDIERPATRPIRSVLSTKKVKPLLSFKNRTWEEAVKAYMKERYA